MKRLILIIIIFPVFLACKKNTVRERADVELYLLETFQLVTGKCQVNAATAVLGNMPLLTNEDFLEYRKDDYDLKLTKDAYQKIKDLTPRTPFAITVNKKVIYYAIFMPSYMSSTCDQSITMDLRLENMIHLRLGYPWPIGAPVDDERNNAELLTAFKNQGKLR
jgi:hypothetical protein